MADTLLDNTFSTNGAFKAFDGKDISKTPLIEANLTALQNYIDAKNSLLVGTLGMALDTKKLYILNIKNNPPTTPHDWVEYSPSVPAASTFENESFIVPVGTPTFALAYTPTKIAGISYNGVFYTALNTDFTTSGNNVIWAYPDGVGLIPSEEISILYFR